MPVYGFDHAKLFPIQGGKGVLWEDAEKAYKTYNRKWPGQTLKRIAERGGFSVAEFVYYYHGIIPGGNEKWEVGDCPNCRGAGEIIDSEEGGIIFKCGKCLGCGSLLPKLKATEISRGVEIGPWAGQPGTFCRPLKANIPEAPAGAVLTNCPFCNAECWKMPKEPDPLPEHMSAGCTACALKRRR
jgi:hypothetical protein